jgi:dsRNA-specific ribonuclease
MSKFNNVYNVKYLTKLKHTFTAKTLIEAFANKNINGMTVASFVYKTTAFDDHINSLNAKTLSILINDVVISLFGGIMCNLSILFNDQKNYGRDYTVCYEIYSLFYASCFNTSDLYIPGTHTLDNKKLIDDKTRLKELYSSKINKPAWSTKNMIEYEMKENVNNIEGNNYLIVKINTWIFGDKRENPQNLKVFSYSYKVEDYPRFKKDMTHKACSEVLKVLETYHIVDRVEPINSYTKDHAFNEMYTSVRRYASQQYTYVVDLLKKLYPNVPFTNQHYNYIVSSMVCKSYDKRFNYEMLEFFGDCFINSTVTLFIKDRFPTLKNIKWITKLKHFLVSREFIYMFAKQYGLSNFILCKDDNDNIEAIYTIEKTNPGKYRALLEDVTESFFGALAIVFQSLGCIEGDIFNICYDLFIDYINKSWNDDMLEYKKLFDPITRLKEIYDMEIKKGDVVVKGKWKTNNIFKILYPNRDSYDKSVTLIIRTWMRGDKTECDYNVVNNYFYYPFVQDDTFVNNIKRDASEKMLIKLTSNLGIQNSHEYCPM